MRRTGLQCGLIGMGLLAFAGATDARGATLALYDFSSGKASSDSDANSIAGAFQFDTEILGTDTDPSVGNPLPSLGALTYHTTIDAAKQDIPRRFSSTLTPADGQAISLHSFRVDVAAYSLNANAYTAQLSVFTSLDNFANPIYFNLATDTTGNNTAISPWSVFTNPQPAFNPLYQNVTTPIEFRYFVFGSAVSAIYLDNVTITGTTTPVPEPGAAAALAGIAALALANRRQRSA
jgi:hypothetical protein